MPKGFLRNLFIAIFGFWLLLFLVFEYHRFGLSETLQENHTADKRVPSAVQVKLAETISLLESVLQMFDKDSSQRKLELLKTTGVAEKKVWEEKLAKEDLILRKLTDLLTALEDIRAESEPVEPPPPASQDIKKFPPAICAHEDEEERGSYSYVRMSKKNFTRFTEYSPQWIMNPKRTSDTRSRASYYCDMLPINSAPWPLRPTKYKESDILVGVFTGQPLYYTRAMAVRDTWFDRLPKGSAAFYSSTEDHLLPIRKVGDFGESYSSVLKKQLYMMIDMYNHNKDKKWFILIGCDNYLNVDYFIRELDKFNWREPLYLGNFGGEYNATIKKKLVTVRYLSGGAGIVFSNPLMRKLVDFIPYFMEHIWPQDNMWSDVATGYAVSLLGYEETLIDTLYGDCPEYIATLNEAIKWEPSMWHFLPPGKLYDIDEFYTFQKFDRLIRSAQMEPVAGMIALRHHLIQFIKAHFLSLRKKQYAIETLARRLNYPISYGNAADIDP